MSITLSVYGGGYRTEWSQHPFAFTFQQMRESSDGLHAEIEVVSTHPDAPGTLHGPVRLNLTSSESQVRFSNALARRYKLIDGNEKASAEAWHGGIDAACRQVQAAYRLGEPPVDLSQGEEPGPIEYLLSPALPLDETSIIYADGESAKSMIALYLGVCCRLGLTTPWGWTPTRQVGVLYLDYETTERVIKRRLWRLARGLGMKEVPPIHYLRPSRMLADDEANLLRHVQGLGVGLVIVDSAGFATEGSLNEDQVARRFLNALRGLRVTRLVVHHISKEAAAQEHGKAKPFGSGYFYNGMRSGFEIRKAETSADGVFELGIFHRKANDGQRLREPVGVRVTFDDPAGPIAIARCDLAANAELVGYAPLHVRIRNVLRDGVTPTTKELAEAVKASEAVVRTTLSRMDDIERLGELHGGKDNPARWRIAEAWYA